jgi:putative ABC transport system permease protein
MRDLVQDLVQDVRHGVRTFSQNPGFTAVAVITLALGIGATTSVFTVADAVILRPLPYEDPDGLVRLYSTSPSRDEYENVVGAADYLDWKEQSQSFEHLSALRRIDYNLVGAEFPLQVSGVSSTPELFLLLGAEAALGRVFTPALDAPEAARTVILSDDLWRSHFAADREVLGRQVKLNNDVYTVIGVMPEGFYFPEGTQLYTSAPYRVPEMPVDAGEDPSEDRGAQYLSVVGRLREGASLEQAQAEMGLIAEQIASEYVATNENQGINVVQLHEDFVGDTRPALFMLLGAVSFVLLIACANVANLLLVQASWRHSELALRMALGAGFRRILRQLMAESVLLALLGGMAGLLLALWGVDALLSLAPDGIPRAAEVSVNLRILGFAVLAVLGGGLLFGLAPASQISDRSLQSAIVHGAGPRSGATRSPLRKILTVGEVAVSLLLLVGAALTMRTFLTLVTVDPGFDTSSTLTGHVRLPESKYEEDAQMVAFYDRALTNLAEIPGVESAGAVLTLPLRWNIRGTFGFAIEDRLVPEDEGEDGDRALAGYQVASTDYFRTLHIPLVRGRLFEATDDYEAPGVALINQALADQVWPDEDPIGKRITWGDPQSEDEEVEWWTIVGIVGNTNIEGLDTDPEPETYLTYAQAPIPFATFVLRARVDPLTLQGQFRDAVLAVDPELPVFRVGAFDEVVSESLGDQRFNMLLLGAFASTAVLMAAVGLYGVLSFSVARRAREIGIRRALGAQQGAVIRQVIWDGFRLVLPGLAIGTVAALLLTRFIASQVYGVSPTDPMSYLLGALLLAIVALAACYLPARRAARVDAMVALRSE